jgi:hypothetical protein
MIKQLAGYYTLTQDDIDSLWDNWLIVLDTNVLLNLYRFSKPTSDEFLRTIRKFESHLWIPDQVRLEFEKNRPEAITKQKESYGTLAKDISRCQQTLENKITEYSRHPFIDVKKIKEPLQKSFQKSFLEVQNELKILEENHPDYFESDPILEELTRIFDGRKGEKYSEIRLGEIYEEGKIRFASKIPPGYMDQDKSKRDPNEQFGDLVLWYQIIDKAKSINKSVLLVIDDDKEDWWFTKKGRRYGPRSELVEEIQAKANVSFYMYNSDRFIQYAKERLQEIVDHEVLTEIREDRSEDDIAEAIRDQEVRIEADRDSFIIGRTVELIGNSNTGENFVRLVIIGPGEYSEGIEVDKPIVSDSHSWKYIWNPGYSIPAGPYTFVVFDPQKRISDEVTVTALKGVISITAAGSQSYYIGEKIKFKGTSTASTSVFLSLRGVNVIPRKLDEFSIISENNNSNSFVEVFVKSDGTWSYTWDTLTVGKFLRAGTYSIYALEGPVSPTNIDDEAFGSISIIIKKPFVSCTASQSTVAQGDSISLTGVAEGLSRQKVQIWIFGNTFFLQDTVQTDTASSFVYTLSPSKTKQLTPGQYFVVVQHPMLNNIFDVYLDNTKKSVVSIYPEVGTPLFAIEGPGSLYGGAAAEALVGAINDPAIDDTYSKCRFLVESPIIRFDLIGHKHIGDLFTITATTNLAVDSEILVEVYSTAFDPEIKYESGKFSGATGTVKVLRGESGLNKISFYLDSSTFFPDEYIVKAFALNSGITDSFIFYLTGPLGFTSLKKIFARLFRK